MLGYLQMVSQNMTALIRNSMKNWRVELTSMGEKLGEVNIRRGIFQGDSFSQILFVMALIPLLTNVRYGLGQTRGISTIFYIWMT